MDGGREDNGLFSCKDEVRERKGKMGMCNLTCLAWTEKARPPPFLWLNTQPLGHLRNCSSWGRHCRVEHFANWSSEWNCREVRCTYPNLKVMFLFTHIRPQVMGRGTVGGSKSHTHTHAHKTKTAAHPVHQVSQTYWLSHWEEGWRQGRKRGVEERRKQTKVETEEERNENAEDGEGWRKRKKKKGGKDHRAWRERKKN